MRHSHAYQPELTHLLFTNLQQLSKSSIFSENIEDFYCFILGTQSALKTQLDTRFQLCNWPDNP